MSLFGSDPVEVVPGAWHHAGFLAPETQQALVETIRGVVRAAPLFVPHMPKTGKPFSVRMTNCGPLGWVSDREKGYRYQSFHPVTGQSWPPMPDIFMEAWRMLASGFPEPEAALINFYTKDARLGLHRDEDEEDQAVPVVSLSLGDDALFRIGGTKRRDPSRSFRLVSGDAFVFGGPARLAYHGVDRLYPGTSDLLENGGRLNITLRRVTPG